MVCFLYLREFLGGWIMTTKEEILSLLLAAEGNVSGEQLSARLQISRAAVNTAVQSLRAGGYEIESSTRTGYRLLRGPDRLREGELAFRLGRERMERVICLESVDSTNNYLKRNAAALPSGTVCMANMQTGGRGRLGRTFQSPADQGVYLSMLLRPEGTPEELMCVTAMTAVAMCRAIEDVCPLRPQVKWVNDLLFGGKKLCGILTELSLEAETGRVQYVIVGAGINVRERAFPGELADIATSLYLAGGGEVSRCGLAARMVTRLDELFADFPGGREDYWKEYRARCATLGKCVRYMREDGEHTGLAKDITDNFGLVVEEKGKRIVLRSGEVSVRPLE